MPPLYFSSAKALLRALRGSSGLWEKGVREVFSSASVMLSCLAWPGLAPRLLASERRHLLVGLAPDHDDPPGFLVHALEQEEGEQEMPEVIRREGGVEAIAGPRLLAEVVEASSEDQGADRR